MARLEESTARGILEIKLSGITAQYLAATKIRSDLKKALEDEESKIVKLADVLSSINAGIAAIDAAEAF